MSMPVIYVAGPFRGENAWVVERNIREAEEAGFEIACAGGVPLIPHTMFRFFDGTQTDEFWLEGTLELLRRCDAIYLLASWERSTGARGEHDEAVRLGLPVFRKGETLIEWIKAWEPKVTTVQP